MGTFANLRSRHSFRFPRHAKATCVMDQKNTFQQKTKETMQETLCNLRELLSLPAEMPLDIPEPLPTCLDTSLEPPANLAPKRYLSW